MPYTNAVIRYTSMLDLEAFAAAEGRTVPVEPDDDECPGCGTLRDEGTTPDCEHADGCGRTEPCADANTY